MFSKNLTENLLYFFGMLEKGFILSLFSNLNVKKVGPVHRKKQRTLGPATKTFIITVIRNNREGLFGREIYKN